MFKWLRPKPKQMFIVPPRVMVGVAGLLTAPGIKRDFGRISNAPIVPEPPTFIEPFVPMCRVIYDDGSTSGWHNYNQTKRKIVAIETRVYGYDFHPRYAALKVD